MAKVIEVSGETLAGVKIFSGLDHAARTAIAARCRGWLYSSDHSIVHWEDTSRDVYFVISGRVRATIYSRSGKEVAFRDLTPGDSFGDLSAIDGERRSASVVAMEESMLVSISAQDFLQVLRSYPDVATTVMCQLTALVRMLSERVVEFSTLGVKNRIHAELLRLAKANSGDGITAEISPAPTHAEIASRVSTHREAVTREFNRLHRSGLLSRVEGTLHILDLERLSNMVAEVKEGG